MAYTISYGTELPSNHGVTSNTTGPQSCWSENPDRSCFNIWRDFYFYSTAVIIPLGLIFNSVSLGVFARSSMRRTIPGRYFMTLAVADNLVLVCEFIMWLNTLDIGRGSRLGIGFFHTVNAWCKMTYFLRYGSRVWSSWVTVSITIERYLTIAFPFRAKRLSSPNKVIVVVLVEAVVCYLLALFAIFMVESGKHNKYTICLIIQDWYEIYHYLTMVLIAGIGELVLPSAIMLVFTCLIIAKLYQAHQRRLRMSSIEAQSQRNQLQPTVALVCIALTFIIVRLPYLILFYINQYARYLFSNFTPWLNLSIYATYKVAQVFAITNYAVNFFIFCMAGNTFRKEMIKCLGHRYRQINQRNMQGSMTSSTMTLRDRMTSHIEMRTTTYGSPNLRGGSRAAREEAGADSNSDSASGSLIPGGSTINNRVSVNGVERENTWR